MFDICLFLPRLIPAMAKRFAVLLIVFASCCVYLSKSIEVKRSRLNSIAGEIKSCHTSREDKDIMEDCLERYKLGFDNLGPFIPGEDPPSCAVDLVSFMSHFNWFCSPSLTA